MFSYCYFVWKFVLLCSQFNREYGSLFHVNTSFQIICLEVNVFAIFMIIIYLFVVGVLFYIILIVMISL